MGRFFTLVAVVSVISFLVTFGLGKLFSRKSFVKYIPSILLALAGIGFYIEARKFSTGFGDLGYFILAIIAVVAFFISLLTAIIMGIMHRNKSE